MLHSATKQASLSAFVYTKEKQLRRTIKWLHFYMLRISIQGIATDLLIKPFLPDITLGRLDVQHPCKQSLCAIVCSSCYKGAGVYTSELARVH